MRCSRAVFHGVASARIDKLPHVEPGGEAKLYGGDLFRRLKITNTGTWASGFNRDGVLA